MKKIAMLASLFVSMFAQANASQLQLGMPAIGGTGCPAGSAQAILSPDNTQISILFDNFIAEAGGNGKQLDRKSCNIAIPVQVPQGFSVSVFKMDYRGYVSVPMGGQGEIRASYFFAGSQGPTFYQRFNGGTNRDYLFTNNLVGVADVWSACGASVILRTNANMMVRTNSQYDDALGTVDSLDAHSGIVYHIRTRRCW